MFYLNLGFIVHSFSRTFIRFLKDCITYFSELYIQSFSVIDLYRIAYEVCMNFMPKKRRMKVLEKLCAIDRKPKLDKIKSTGAQHTMKPKFR